MKLRFMPVLGQPALPDEPVAPGNEGLAWKAVRMGEARCVEYDGVEVFSLWVDKDKRYLHPRVVIVEGITPDGYIVRTVERGPQGIADNMPSVSVSLHRLKKAFRPK